MKDKSHRTAITRKKLSRPARLFKPYLEGRVLDCGCGKGFDADELGAVKYDPYFFQVKPEKESFDTVLSIYVLNATTYPGDVLKIAKEYVKPGGLIMVATRTVREIDQNAAVRGWRPYQDGWLTKHETFQRGLSAWNIAQMIGWDDIILQGSREFSYVIARRPNEV